MIKLLFTMVIVAMGLPVQAQSTWLHVYGRSWHHDAGYNGHNWGVGAEVQIKPGWSAAVGTYDNSIDHRTWYAAAKHQIWQQGQVVINLSMGAATGYQTAVIPVVLPEACWRWLCGFALPRVGPGTTDMAAVYLRIPIW